MRPVSLETCDTFPEPAETLAVLDTAMRAGPAAKSRVLAGDDSRSVDEGLAVLRCYVSIADRRVRQAILDLLVSTTSAGPSD